VPVDASHSKVAQAAQGLPLARREEAQHEEDVPNATVREILRKLSYSSTFLEAATRSAAEKSLKHAYWALAQYDFVYKPRRGRKVDERAPFFLGVFDWNDAEDDALLAAWARGEE
jgi:hypothetical protein